MTSPPEERRAVVRYPSSHDAHLLDPSWPGLVLVAVVRDVSIRGVGLLVKKEIRAGSEITIEIQEPGQDCSRYQAQVVHAAQQAHGGWLLGCTFADILKKEELTALL